MLPIINATGLVDIYTADGGPNQKRWHNLRIYAQLTGGTGDGMATVKVNGEDAIVPDGEFQVKVTPEAPKATNSYDLLLTTGDVVKIAVTGTATLDLLVSDNICTEEL